MRLTGFLSSVFCQWPRQKSSAIDLRPTGEPARKWIERRLQRPIVLTERIYDTAILRTGEDEYVWFLHIHHIIVDGAAVQILIRRVTELYWGAIDKTLGFPQFADHAASACAQRQSEKYRAARDYWLNTLKQVPPTPHFYGVDAFKNTAQERVILTLDRAASTNSPRWHDLWSPRPSASMPSWRTCSMQCSPPISAESAARIRSRSV